MSGVTCDKCERIVSEYTRTPLGSIFCDECIGANHAKPSLPLMRCPNCGGLTSAPHADGCPKSRHPAMPLLCSQCGRLTDAPHAPCPVGGEGDLPRVWLARALRSLAEGQQKTETSKALGVLVHRIAAED